MAASGGAGSGMIGAGRLDPYRAFDHQGEGLAGFAAHRWLDDDAADSQEKQEAAVRAAEAAAPLVAAGEPGVSVRGLRARRPVAANAVRARWEGVLGPRGVARLEAALRAMDYEPQSWLAKV